ncbi:MAG: ribonuclease P protein component [Pseudomonadota bacterium]
MKALKPEIEKIGRLKKRSDFLWVQQNGRKWIAKSLIVEMADNTSRGERLGIRYGLTVSKKVSKLAVKRNLIKRRLRAVAQEVLPDYAAQNLDVVLIARAGADTKDFDILKRDFIWCLKKMEITP